MADAKSTIEIEINGISKSLNSVKDLKGAIKELQDIAESSDIGSEQYKKAIEQIELLNEKLKEVTQTEKQAAKSAEELAKAEKEAAKETQDLRKQFEVLEDELFLLAGQGKQNSERFKQLTIEAANLNKKIDDVNQSLSGGGAERAEAGFSKFNESLKKLDFKGVAQGAKLMGTALAATGVMLIVQAVGYLIENFESLKNSTGLVGKVFQGIGSIIDSIGEKINWLADKLGLIDSEMEAMGEAIKTNADKATEALSRQTAEYDRQISIAKASGKSAVDLEIAKQQAIIQTNKALFEQTLAHVKAGGVLTEEQEKLVKAALEQSKNAQTQIQILRLQEEQKEKESNAKQLADYKKLQDEKLKERLAFLDRQRKIDEEGQAFADELERLRIQKEEKDALFAAELEQREQMNVYYDELRKQRDAKIQEEITAKRKIEEQQRTQEALQIAQQGTQSLQNLSNAYFDIKLAKAKKGSAEEEKLARQQFKINKALMLTMAIIDGAKAVTSSLAQAPVALGPIPNPAGIASLALAVTSSIASIAKIASTQYNANSSGSAGGGGISAPTPNIPSPPTISTPNNNVSGTQFDSSGNVIPQQQSTPAITVTAQVVETEITDSQKTIANYKRQSTF